MQRSRTTSRHPHDAVVIYHAKPTTATGAATYVANFASPFRSVFIVASLTRAFKISDSLTFGKGNAGTSFPKNLHNGPYHKRISNLSTSASKPDLKHTQPDPNS